MDAWRYEGFVKTEGLLMKDFAINDIFVIIGIINSLLIHWKIIDIKLTPFHYGSVISNKSRKTETK